MKQSKVDMNMYFEDMKGTPTWRLHGRTGPGTRRSFFQCQGLGKGIWTPEKDFLSMLILIVDSKTTTFNDANPCYAW